MVLKLAKVFENLRKVAYLADQFKKENEMLSPKVGAFFLDELVLLHSNE